MTPTAATITIMKFCKPCQTETARQPSNGKCTVCLRAYAAEYRERQRTGKPKKINGRPPQQHAVRNKQIIADFQAGMSFQSLANKYHLGVNYMQKLASGYVRQDRTKLVELQTFGECSLYQERDRLAILDMACHFGVTGRRINADLIHSKGLS